MRYIENCGSSTVFLFIRIKNKLTPLIFRCNFLFQGVGLRKGGGVGQLFGNGVTVQSKFDNNWKSQLNIRLLQFADAI